MPRILLLGGTSEASALARALAEAGADAVFSYAGRTGAPIAQPLPTRVGGFGGVAGLVDYLRAERITHLVDATHPFAAGMSRNAIDAAAETGVPLIALERPPWRPGPGDDWRRVTGIDAAVDRKGPRVGADSRVPGRAHRVRGRGARRHFALAAGALLTVMAILWIAFS